MTGMFQCAAGGWCGWGFPKAAGEMIGASALIARTCAACASAAQPILPPCSFHEACHCACLRLLQCQGP